MTNNHGSCQLSGCRLVVHEISRKKLLERASPAPSAIYFCIKLQFGPDSQFSTIYTDIIVINNAQTCHTLVLCVFDWSALGSRHLMIQESGVWRPAILSPTVAIMSLSGRLTDDDDRREDDLSLDCWIPGSSWMAAPSKDLQSRLRIPRQTQWYWHKLPLNESPGLMSLYFDSRAFKCSFPVPPQSEVLLFRDTIIDCQAPLPHRLPGPQSPVSRPIPSIVVSLKANGTWFQISSTSLHKDRTDLS